MMVDELNCSLFVYTAIISCQNKSDKKAIHTYIFFFKIKNCLNNDLFISCNDRIGKMLHSICISQSSRNLSNRCRTAVRQTETFGRTK